MIKKGTIVSTSYNTGPYEVTEVLHDCTCASYVDTINGKEDNYSKPHLHITCKPVGGKDRDKNYLNGYALDNGVYRSVWADDYLIIHNSPEVVAMPDVKPIQLQLFI